MEARSSPRPLVVTTAAAAQTLADPLRQRFLAPFLGRDCTVARAAAELGTPLNSLLYRVKRAEAAGLLGVVRETPRAGRAVKVYRSVADAFYVPFALTRAATLEALLAEMEAPYKAAFYQSVAESLTRAETEVGLVVWRSAAGEVRTRFATGPGVRSARERRTVRAAVLVAGSVARARRRESLARRDDRPD